MCVDGALMRRFPLILLAAGLVGGIGAAQAADILEPALKAPPAVMSAPSWTGLYVGVSLGGRSANVGWNTTAIQFPFGFGANAIGPDPTTAGAGFNGSTPRAGIFYGYNWQIGSQFVVSVESDLAWGN